MDKLTIEEIEIIVQCVKLDRLKLSPVPSNDIEKKIYKTIEEKLQIYLGERICKENENT